MTVIIRKYGFAVAFMTCAAAILSCKGVHAEVQYKDEAPPTALSGNAYDNRKLPNNTHAAIKFGNDMQDSNSIHYMSPEKDSLVQSKRIEPSINDAVQPKTTTSALHYKYDDGNPPAHKSTAYQLQQEQGEDLITLSHQEMNKVNSRNNAASNMIVPSHGHEDHLMQAVINAFLSRSQPSYVSNKQTIGAPSTQKTVKIDIKRGEQK